MLKLLQDILSGCGMNVKTLATALGVDVKTIQNYAKTAKGLKLELRETKGNYNLLEFIKFLHQMWKKTEKETQKNTYAKDEQEKHFMLKNIEKEFDIKKKSGELLPVDLVEHCVSYFTVSTSNAIDSTHNEINAMLRDKIEKQINNKVSERFNELKLFLNQLSFDDIPQTEEAALNKDYTLTIKPEANNGDNET